MTGTLLERIDPDRLGAPLAGAAPGGAWLRYDPVYDQIKQARTAEADYLPQGIWQREVKRADWETAADLAREALESRTKDLQFAAWLTEALTHLHGLAGMAVGLRVIDRLASNVWDGVYPEIDPDDGEEPRLLVLAWLDRVLPEGLDEMAVTAPGTRLVEPFTLREWQEIERREREEAAQAARASGGPSRGRGMRATQVAASEGPTRDDLNTSIRMTAPEVYERLNADLAEARAALSAVRTTFDTRCGSGSARFPRTETALTALAKRLSEAEQQRAEAAPRAAPEDTAPEDAAADVAADAPTATETAEPSAPADEPPAPPATRRKATPETRRDLAAEVRRIQDRDLAYRVLEALSARLVELDPHSPSPYLARRAGSFRNQTFADLVMHFVDDERMRKHLFRLLGLGEEMAAEGAPTEADPDEETGSVHARGRV